MQEATAITVKSCKEMGGATYVMSEPLTERVPVIVQSGVHYH